MKFTTKKLQKMGVCAMKQNVISLVTEFQNGNEEAFQALYEETYEDAFRMAMKQCKDHQDALDVCQESYMEVYRSIHQLKDPASFYVWFSRIIKSKCIRIFRKKHHITLDQSQLELLPNQIEQRKQYLPEEFLAETSEQELMRRFVTVLSPKLQEVIKLVYFEQYTLEETSAYLQIPIGTVKSRLFKGREILKQHMKKFEQKEGRRIHFHEGISTWLFSQYVLCKAYAKQIVTTHVTMLHTALNVVSVVSAVSVGVVVYQGGVQVVEEWNTQNQQESITEPSQQVSQSKPQAIEIKPLNFHVSYQSKVFENPKNAYYEIIRWGKSPELAKEQKTQGEISEIAPVYQEIKKLSGPYYDMLIHDGWNIVFEQL